MIRSGVSDKKVGRWKVGADVAGHCCDCGKHVMRRRCREVEVRKVCVFFFFFCERSVCGSWGLWREKGGGGG